MSLRHRGVRQLHPSVCVCTGVRWCKDAYVGVLVTAVKGRSEGIWMHLMENQMLSDSLLPRLNPLCEAPLFWRFPKRPAWHQGALLENTPIPAHHLSTTNILFSFQTVNVGLEMGKCLQTPDLHFALFPKYFPKHIPNNYIIINIIYNSTLIFDEFLLPPVDTSNITNDSR